MIREWTIQEILKFALFVIMLAVLLGTLVSVLNYAISSPTNTTLISYDGITYKCYHYPNEMECVSIDDPDVGMGQVLP